MFIFFEDEFKGEIVYKTPRWKILNEPIPDLKSMYKINHNIHLPKLKLNLFDYQDFGSKYLIDILYKSRFAICADDVGLGKTPTAITVTKWFIEQQRYKKVLILCKKSLKMQWCDEFDKFTNLSSHMTIDYTKDTKKKRMDLYNQIINEDKGIIVSNYSIGLNDYKELGKVKFDLVIIDEAHILRNITTKSNQAIKKICNKAKRLLFLTGTPVMSRPKDAYGITYLGNKNFFGQYDEFEKKYIVKDYSGRFVKEVGVKCLDELRDKIQSIIIRRTENEISLKMPKVINQQINVDLDNYQKSLIEFIDEDKSNKTEILNKLEGSKDKKKQQIVIAIKKYLKGLHNAYQAIADDPRILFMSKSKNIEKKFKELYNDKYIMSSKTEALIDKLHEIVDADKKAIVFSKFRRATNLLKQDIEKRINCKVELYNGIMTDEERHDAISRFKNDNEYHVLLMTEAGNEGLNLPECNFVINYDLPDTPAIMTQRIGRARRANSKFQNIYAINLITNNSVDIKKLDNLKKYKNIFDSMVEIDEAQSNALKEIMNTPNGVNKE